MVAVGDSIQLLRLWPSDVSGQSIRYFSIRGVVRGATESEEPLAANLGCINYPGTGKSTQGPGSFANHLDQQHARKDNVSQRSETGSGRCSVSDLDLAAIRGFVSARCQNQQLMVGPLNPHQLDIDPVEDIRASEHPC